MNDKRRAELNKKIAGWLYPNLPCEAGYTQSSVRVRWAAFKYHVIDFVDPEVMVQVLEKFNSVERLHRPSIRVMGFKQTETDCWWEVYVDRCRAIAPTLTEAVALAAEEVIDAEADANTPDT